MITELNELNRAFYPILIELDTYKEQLTSKQYEFMKQAIYKQYEKEYVLRDLQCSIAYDRLHYNASRSAEHLTPRRKRTFFWFFRKKKWHENDAAALLDTLTATQAELTHGDELQELLDTAAQYTLDPRQQTDILQKLSALMIREIHELTEIQKVLSEIQTTPEHTAQQPPQAAAQGDMPQTPAKGPESLSEAAEKNTADAQETAEEAPLTGSWEDWEGETDEAVPEKALSDPLE